MSLLRRFIRNCSSFFFLLFCFLFFSVSVFASTNISYPVSFSDCATHGASCTDLQTDVSDIDVDGGTEYVSTNWPDDPFTFSGSAWSDNSNPYFVQFNFNPNIDSSDTVLDAKVEYDGIFVPIDCNSNSECRFKFLSSTNGFAAIEEIHNQDNLSLSPVLDLSIPSSQFNLLNSLSLRLLAYGTPSDTSYSGFNSQIDYVKLTATVDEDPPSVPVLEWPIGGAYIDDNTPLMQWADSTDDESGIKNYLYRVYYNCSDSLDIPASCSSLYPDEDGLVRTSSEYQGGSTSDGTYYWQARAVDGTDKMSDWSGLEEVTIDTVSPVVSNLQVDKSLVTAGDIITIEADVVDSSGISAVSADFAYNQTYTSRPSPTSVGMTYISGDTYRVQYTVPTSWNDGDMYIKIAARDNTSRNWMRSVEQEIIEVDSTAPTVSIDAPSAGFVNGQVVINGSVIDDHPHHYWLVIQNDQGQTIAGPGEVGETNSLTDHDFMTWDTNGVVDGNYTIILHARDTLDLKDANSMTEVVVTVDNTGPDSPIIFTPFVEEYFNTTPILATWSEVSDSSGIDYYRIQYEYDDGHTFYHTTPYTNKNHTPGIGEQGGVSFRVQAFDTLGNEGDWSGWRHYYYDATSPSAPGDPFTIPNPTNILTQNWSWTASIDTGGISQYLWRIPGYSNGAVLGTSLETSLGEGSWNLFVKAEDNAGNEGDESESLELVVDTTSPPTPTGLKFLEADHFTEHQCGDVIFKQVSIPVWNEYLGSDFSHYEYSSFHPSGAQGLNEKILYTATLENSWLAPADGAYGFAVRTVDLAGNKSAWALSSETLEGSCQIIYDSVPPVVTVDPLVINDTTPALSGTVSDEHQIDFLTVTVDGQSSDLAIIHGDGRWTLADDILSPLADGLYDVVAEATDEAGNVGTDATTDELRIDSVAPTAVFIHYIDGLEFIGSIAYVNDINRLTFTGEYIDPVPSSELKQDSFVIFDAQADGSFRFSANGAKAYCSWRSGANTIPLSGLIDTLTAIPFAHCENPLGEGEYYMTHQVYDNAIRKDIPSITQFRDVLGLHFVIDTTNPVISITSPLNGETISGTTTITVTATDSTSGVERVELSYRAVGDATWIPLDTLFVSPYTYDWNTTGYPLGDYELQAEAFDLAGNSEVDQIEVGVAAVISGETGSTPYFGQIYVSWFTDRPTTAQVVYDTVPHLFADPNHVNYGYAYSTSVFDLAKTTYHETTLTGLNDQTVYYYRFISAGSPTAVSGEMSNRTFSSSGPGSPPSSGPSGGGTPSPLVAYVSPSVMGVYTTPASVLPEEGEILGEETTPTPEPEKSPPSITTPTPRVLGAFTSVSPLYFLGGGLLISLILMLLLFRRE